MRIINHGLRTIAVGAFALMLSLTFAPQSRAAEPANAPTTASALLGGGGGKDGGETHGKRRRDGGGGGGETHGRRDGGCETHNRFGATETDGDQVVTSDQ